MTIAERPDVLGAIVKHLRANSAVAAVAGIRISGELQDAWWTPSAQPQDILSAIVIRAAGGPILPEEDEVEILNQRLDMFFYGSSGLNAMRLWRVVDPNLRPSQGNARTFTETVNSVKCRIYTVELEGGPNVDVDPDTGWHRAIASYIVKWAGVPG